ncbi:MAG: FCD domain-containing protein [Candidatus Dormiibacterota bacterium]
MSHRESESPISRPLRSLAHERLTDQAAAALREHILANKLAPGTRLPPETALSTTLGVSRNVLRQAVASLQGLGMLRVTHGSGTYVADLADTDVFRQIAAWVGPDTLSEEEYFEVRAIWERGVLELAFERALPADLDELDDLAAAMNASDDPEEVERLHHEFHEALLRVAGNHFLVTLGIILHRFFWELAYQGAHARKPPLPRLLGSHQEIVDLLRAGDVAAIPRMIELHLAPRLGSDERPLPRTPTASVAHGGGDAEPAS